jgi:hypothetical protein
MFLIRFILIFQSATKSRNSKLLKNGCLEYLFIVALLKSSLLKAPTPNRMLDGHLAQKERFKFLKNGIDKCWHLGTILIFKLVACSSAANDALVVGFFQGPIKLILGPIKLIFMLAGVPT